MKIFVTGGAGFIGSNFIRYLLGLHRDLTIVNYDKLTYAGNLTNLGAIADDPNYQFVRGDVCEAAAVESAMRGCEAVVHFAAESHVDRSVYEPAAAIQTNVAGTFVLLQVARQLGVTRFLQISTDEVYGDLSPNHFAGEDAPLRPSNPYSASKAAAGLLVTSFVRTYGLPAIITRSSNNYGPYQFPEKFLPLMIKNALEDKPLPIYGDGKQQRNWLHVTDNCAAIFAVLERGRCGEVYNIGDLEVHENLDVAQRVLDILGKPKSLLTSVADRPGHDRRYALTSEKIRIDLGFEPEIRFEAGLVQTIDWYRANPRWVASVCDGEYRSYYSKYYLNRNASLASFAQSPKTVSLGKSFEALKE